MFIVTFTEWHERAGPVSCVEPTVPASPAISFSHRGNLDAVIAVCKYACAMALQKGTQVNEAVANEVHVCASC